MWYFGWLLNPDRIGTPVPLRLLIVAEIFNLMQALGFWWTCANERLAPAAGADDERPAVDVLVPVYNEPVDIVEPTVAAARGCAARAVRVWLLDDGNATRCATLAARQARATCAA